MGKKGTTSLLHTRNIIIKTKFYFKWPSLKYLKNSKQSYRYLLLLTCVKSVQIRSYFWSEFSFILTEYRDLRRKSLYSVQIQENTDEKKLRIWTFFTQCQYEKTFRSKTRSSKICKYYMTCIPRPK